ncbi:MAG: hypothetical protein GC168_17110 [Candidatus Hydrogenedens sp.]|nr:hypothetical protein [Candidatus Hydrogenedens sp.]
MKALPHLLLAGLIALTALSSQGDEGEGAGACIPPLKLMTFNIRFFSATPGVDQWGPRKPLVEDLINRYAPDAAGLQEAEYIQWFFMLPKLPGYAALGVGRNDGGTGGEYALILYRTERLEVLDSGTFWYSETPEVPGSISWGANNPRICTWARFRDKATDATFYLANSHLDNGSSLSRANSVDLLLERMAAWEDPVYLTGDFNMGETSTPIVKLKSEAGLVDTFRVVEPDTNEAKTFHDFSGGTVGSKIDYIFAPAEAVVSGAAILRDTYDGKYPSDHYPVIASIGEACAVSEGEGITEGEGVLDGEGMAGGEGFADGEGAMEGEGSSPPAYQTADIDQDSRISLPELLRVVQFYNAGAFACSPQPEETEDGYVPGTGDDFSCAPHTADYGPEDWSISLSELLRVLQFFNSGGYTECPEAEDGFCPLERMAP